MIEEVRNNRARQISIKEACLACGVSVNAFYYYLRVKNMNKLKDEVILKEIEDIIREFAGYGYRRITRELKDRKFESNGKNINHKRVLRIMKDNNLTVKRKRRFKINTTDSNHSLKIYPNLIKSLEITKINQVWVADITYIRLLRGFVYLAVILDAYSRKAIGFMLRKDLTEELALGALKMALNCREVPQGLIHHSDRGVQYSSISYTNLLKENHIQISMSRKGNCYDNAKAESFFKTIKTEEVNLSEYENYEEAKLNIAHFIEDVYNQKRLHSSIGYMSPVNFEEALITNLSVPI